MPGRDLAGVAVAAASSSGGVLRVRLEDVSRADAAATVVALVEQSVPGPLRPGEEVPFRLTLPVLDPRRRYGLRAHLDRAGDGAVSPGDLVTTQAYPVDAATDGVRLELRPA